MKSELKIGRAKNIFRFSFFIFNFLSGLLRAIALAMTGHAPFVRHGMER